jgi:aminoglycoside phosphotransferase (APT) family kinase protein
VADAKVAITFVHGDLIPGNLLLTGGRLAAIIDWGSAGYGDPAQDLTPAWAVFDGSSRQIFLEATGGDDATRLRARAFALEQAVGGVLYYTPRRHPLGDVMARTLHRILNAGE